MSRRRPGRNVPVAVGVGAVLGALVLVSLYTVKEIFLGVVVIALGIALNELARAFATRGIRVPLLPVAVGGLGMLVTAYLVGPAGLVVTFALTAIAVMVWRMPEGTHGYVRDAAAGVFAAAYVPLLAGFAAMLLQPDDGAERTVTFIAVTVCSDIGGFFAGSFMGRHPMAPAISPKKTWEGFAGSALACMACGAVAVPLLLDGRVWQGVVLGAAVVGVATFGDLVESIIKRDLGIKDMGSLLPEHGGIMDRLDSLLATAPVAWLVLVVFIPS